MVEITLGFVAAICWGIHDFLVRFIVKKVNIITALISTNLISVSVLLIFFYLSRNDKSLEIELVGISLIYGLLFLLATYSLYKAFNRGPIYVAAPIICSYPILSLFYAAILTDPPSLHEWLLSIFVIFGIILTVVAKSKSQKTVSFQIFGTIIWSIFAAICFSLSFLLGQHQSINSFEILSNLIARVSAVLVLGTLLFNQILFKSLKPNYILILIFMGIVDTLALLIMVYSGNFDNPEFSSVSASTFGVITILLVCFFYKEILNRIQIFGIILVFTSIAILSFGKN